MIDATQPSPRGRILIVDDEDDTARVLGRALKVNGLQIRRAASVNEALALVDDWHPDLVISDYSMPERSGGDLLEALSARVPSLIAAHRFLFLTGHPELARIHADPRGLTVIPKPYRLEHVRSLVLGALGLEA